MNYSNIYPMDTIYPTTSLEFPFEPEDKSVPSYQIPTVSSEIEYSSPSIIRIGVFEVVL